MTLNELRRLAGIQEKPDELARLEASVPEVEGVVAAQLARNYKLLSGLVERVTLVRDVPEVLPPEGPPEQQGGPQPWTKVLSKKSFSPEKGHQFSTEGDEAAALNTLGDALRTCTLPTERGEERIASPEEFLFQGRHIGPDGKTSWAHFKHRDTRNHLHLGVATKELVVPVVRDIFQYGTFDKVEHAETFAKLRSLSGIA